jgi:hypothetical protein
VAIEAHAGEAEWVVPLPKPRDEIADATHFRSTWLTASLQTVRERGLYDRYEEKLDPQHKAAVLGAVPGVWLPMEVAYAHYLACEQLELPGTELYAIGKAAMRRANVTTMQFASRVAQGAGVTPWTILAQAPRFWERTCLGGALAVARLGPKEARIEMLGFPLAELRYNRVTMRGIAAAFIELLSKTVYVTELPAYTSARRIGMRAAWA